MTKFLQLALWNANGLTQHTQELKMLISHHSIDVMLISETHFAVHPSWNCPWRNRYINENHQQTSSAKQL
jgi:hypothetical protein